MGHLELAIAQHDNMMEEANKQHKLEQDDMEDRLAAAGAAHTNQLNVIEADIHVHEQQLSRGITRATYLGSRIDKVEAAPPAMSSVDNAKLIDAQKQAS